jgi:capsular polysaccharide biosynthesis protein
MKRKLISSQVIKRKLPENFNEEDAFFLQFIEHRLPDIHIHEYQHVNVTHNGLILKGLRILTDYDTSLAYFLKRKLSRKWFYVKALLVNYLLKKKIKSNPNKKYLVVHDDLSNGYYHWMLEVLPRLFLAINNVKNFTLILPEGLTEFQKESLKFFNIQAKVFINKNEYLAVKNLIIPDYTASKSNHNPKVILPLQDFLLEQISVSQQQKFKHYQKVFLTRKRAKMRKIVNEQEVEALLVSEGYTIVDFEDHSYLDQIAICSNIKHLVAIHGAGLANLLFMNSCRSLLELRSSDQYQKGLSYYKISNILFIDYYYLNCIPTKKCDYINTDITVSLKSLKKSLSILI